MTRKSRREIERALADAREEITPDPEVTIMSGGVTVVTSDMVDEHGNTIDDKTPDPDAPDGFEFGPEIPTESPVVTWRELIPVDDAENTDR